MKQQMLASELVQNIQAAIKEQGDLPFRFVSTETYKKPDDQYGGSLPVSGFVTVLRDDDEPSYFLIGDPDTINSLEE